MALELFDLGRLVRGAGPVYAGLYRGADGRELPDRSIMEMARRQARIIREVQPHGPYRLGGFSLGALIALETARALVEEDGESVAFLGLIEPNLPERFWPRKAKRAFLLRRAKTHLDMLRGLSPRQAIAYARDRAKPLGGRLARLLGARSDAAASPYALAGLPPTLAAVRDAGLAAFYAYEIRPYDGHVIFFDSQEGDPLSCRPLEAFPPFVHSYERFSVGGSHSTMLRRPHVVELAEAMSGVLARLDGSRTTAL